MFVEFDESLVTGNETIDAQHKEWIAKIDELLISCETGDGKVKASDYVLIKNSKTTLQKI